MTRASTPRKGSGSTRRKQGEGGWSWKTFLEAGAFRCKTGLSGRRTRDEGTGRTIRFVRQIISPGHQWHRLASLTFDAIGKLVKVPVRRRRSIGSIVTIGTTRAIRHRPAVVVSLTKRQSAEFSPVSQRRHPERLLRSTVLTPPACPAGDVVRRREIQVPRTGIWRDMKIAC